MTPDKALTQLVEQTIEEITTTGDIGGYNAPLMFTKNNAETVAGFDEFNKQHKKHGSITKKELEKKLGQTLDGKRFTKMSESGDEQIGNISYAGLLSSLLTEAPVIASELVEDDEIDTSNTPQQEISTVDKFSDIDKVNSILFKLAITQPLIVYNEIFVPFFTYVSAKFNAKNEKCFPLLKAYNKFHDIIRKTKSGDLTHEARAVYQELLEFHVSLQATLKLYNGNLNLEPLTQDASIDQLKDRLVVNAKAISSLFNTVLAPLQNGYTTAIGTIEVLTEKHNITRTDEFKEIDKSFADVITYANRGQKSLLTLLFSNKANDIFGSWLRSRIEKQIENLQELKITIPTSKINAKQAADVAVKTAKKATSVIKQTTTSLTNFIKNYVTVFTAIGNDCEQYQESLFNFTKSLDLAQFITPKMVNTTKIKQEIKQNDPGFFNQRADEVVKEFVSILKQNRKVIPDQNGVTSEDEAQQSEEQQKQISKNAQEYVYNDLQITNENEQTYVSTIVRNLRNAVKDNENGFSVPEIDGQTDTANIIKKGAFGKGSIQQLIQSWLVLAVKNQLILFGASKYSFDLLLTDIKKEALDPDESTRSRVEPLITLMRRKKFTARESGHDVSWQATEQTEHLINDLIIADFVTQLTRIDEESLWRQLFLTIPFFKGMVYSDNGNDSEADSLDDVVNERDVQKAEEILDVDPKQIDEKKEDFTTVIKQIANTYTMGDNVLKVTNATSFKGLVGKYTTGNIPGKTALQILVAGKVVVLFIKDYFKDRRANMYRKVGNTIEEMAKTFSDKLLHYDKSLTPTKEDITDLAANVKDVLYCFDENFHDKIVKRDGVKPEENKRVIASLGATCSALYNVFTSKQ